MSQDDILNTRHSYTSTRPDIQAKVPPSAMHILDVGCSNGALGAALRAMVPGRVVEGIEYDTTFCQEASAKLDRVIQGDLNHFDWNAHFNGTLFDCMIFADVLEHLVDPWHVLSQAVEYLRPGGTAIVSVPNIRHISSLNSIFLRGTFPRIGRGLFDGTHLRWFTCKDARHLLEGSGLQLVSLSANLRINDLPETSLNHFAQRHLARFEKWPWVKEFLGYQFVLVGVKS